MYTAPNLEAGEVGQGEELEPARAKAEMMGASDIYIEDVREEFVRDFVFPRFRANAVYEGLYLLGTSIARPLISKRLVEISAETGADAERGEVGPIAVYDLANTGSVLAVLTADLGRRIGDGFEVLGRQAGAEARGCSIAVDELLGSTS